MVWIPGQKTCMLCCMDTGAEDLYVVLYGYRGRRLIVEEVNSVQKVVVSVRDKRLGLAR